MAIWLRSPLGFAGLLGEDDDPPFNRVETVAMFAAIVGGLLIGVQVLSGWRGYILAVVLAYAFALVVTDVAQIRQSQTVLERPVWIHDQADLRPHDVRQARR